MMQGMRGRCPMCGMMMGGQPMQAQGAPNLNEIRNQIQNLQRQLDQLEMGQTSPQQVQQQMPQMCPMCQGVMSGMGATPNKEEMETGIQQQIQELNRRVSQLEHGRQAGAG